MRTDPAKLIVPIQFDYLDSTVHIQTVIDISLTVLCINDIHIKFNYCSCSNPLYIIETLFPL
jgi:hypothetical protein